MPSKSTARKPKAIAIEALKHLGESASYEDMMYELYVLQKIERGRKELRDGTTVSHDNAKSRLGKWLK